MLSLARTDDAPIETVRLGGDLLQGEKAQKVIPPHWWQAAEPVEGEHGYVLVSCVVAPGFEFSGFELAKPGWEPAA